MTLQVQLSVANIGGLIQTSNSGPQQAGADGLITVNTSDAVELLRLGASYIASRSSYQTLLAAPRASSAGRLVASTTLSNGTLSIANQPDVPRQALLRVDPGTVAISAGNVAVNYVANDGTTQIDNMSPITAASTLSSITTSKGVVLLNSVILTGITGGATPHVQLNDTNALAVQVDPGFVDFACVEAWTDAAGDLSGASVVASAGCITPNTAPNGTHTFAFVVNYKAPAV